MTLATDGFGEVVKDLGNLGDDNDGVTYSLWTSYSWKHMAMTYNYYGETQPVAIGWQESTGATQNRVLCVGR